MSTNCVLCLFSVFISSVLLPFPYSCGTIEIYDFSDSLFRGLYSIALGRIWSHAKIKTTGLLEIADGRESTNSKGSSTGFPYHPHRYRWVLGLTSIPTWLAVPIKTRFNGMLHIFGLRTRSTYLRCQEQIEPVTRWYPTKYLVSNGIYMSEWKMVIECSICIRAISTYRNEKPACEQ
jgi:hypothetical protein